MVLKWASHFQTSPWCTRLQTGGTICAQNFSSSTAHISSVSSPNGWVGKSCRTPPWVFTWFFPSPCRKNVLNTPRKSSNSNLRRRLIASFALLLGSAHIHTMQSLSVSGRNGFSPAKKMRFGTFGHFWRRAERIWNPKIQGSKPQLAHQNMLKWLIPHGFSEIKFCGVTLWRWQCRLVYVASVGSCWVVGEAIVG